MQKAKDNAKKSIYKNVEFRAGDTEKRIPLDDNTVDVVASNCIIKLKSNKVNAFKEIYRILKPNAIGKMIILGLVTGKEVGPNSINSYN
jgi:ubiquinone/menaquinone biosynthesis C-methylase UbiE